jgi:hypothetical protein
MDPGTKRKIIYIIIAMSAGVIIVGLTAYIWITTTCTYPCIMTPLGCDCPPPTIPTLPPGLPEGIPGFPLEAILLGFFAASFLILGLRRRKQ